MHCATRLVHAAALLRRGCLVRLVTVTRAHVVRVSAPARTLATHGRGEAAHDAAAGSSYEDPSRRILDAALKHVNDDGFVKKGECG